MKHILLLEDDQALGRGIAMALETPNCAVICSGTLGQAAEHLADQRFELLILDINLPDGSGLDLLRHYNLESIIPTSGCRLWHNDHVPELYAGYP